jgi:hypothetical protein
LIIFAAIAVWNWLAVEATKEAAMLAGSMNSNASRPCCDRMRHPRPRKLKVY